MVLNYKHMKVLMVVAQKNFRDEEFFEPRDVLIKNGIEVKVASQEMETAQGRLGGTVMPDMTLSEAEVDDFSAVIFVGGPGAAVFLDDPDVHRLADDFYKSGRWVAAICIAPSILANAGMLIGKRATCTASEEGNLKNKGANFTGTRVEVDGKIVTASGPEAAREFGKKLVELLKS
jgi:protease I